MLKANDLIDKSNKIINEAKKVFLEQDDKVNMSKLKNEIQAAVSKYFKDDKDLLEYVHIETKKDKFGRDVLEVRAELGYNSMVKLADYLNKIVTKYDKYAYFEQETSGIMIAVFEPSQKNEAKNVFLEEDDKIYDQGQTLKGVNWKTFIIDEKDVNFIDMNLHYLKLKQVYDHPEYGDKIFWILDNKDRTLTILSNKITDMIGKLLNEPDILVLSWNHLTIPSKMEVK